jgi:pilin isopeptide linkage protein
VRETTGDTDKTDPTGKRYNRFEITFNNTYAATSTTPLTIDYKIHLGNIARDEDWVRQNTGDHDGYFKDKDQQPYFGNYCKWLIPDDGKMIELDQKGGDTGIKQNIPLRKDDGNYTSDGTVTWNVYVNCTGTVKGTATLVEYLPTGLLFDKAEITARAQESISKNTTLGEPSTKDWVDETGKTIGTIVSIPIEGLEAYKGISSGEVVDYYSDLIDFCQVTVTITTKVDSTWYMNLTSSQTLTNTAVLTDNTALPKDGVKATGTVRIASAELMTKSKATTAAPAYVEYALNVNPNALTFAGTEMLEVVDIMGTGMSLATDREDYFKVYDVTNVANVTDSDGKIIVSNVTIPENDITEQCTIEDITDQPVDGMKKEDVGKPTYKITVPNGKHVAIVYWAAFEGAEGESVTVTNKASFFYNGALQDSGGTQTEDQVSAIESSSDMYTGPYFNLRKTDQFGTALSGATFALYEVTVSDGTVTIGDAPIMTRTTESDGLVTFGQPKDNVLFEPELQKDKLYCLIETAAPAGCKKDNEIYYFEIMSKGGSALDVPTNITLHQYVVGGTYTFVNEFEAGSVTIPVKKTLNGELVSNNREFTFNLTQESGSTAYINSAYTKALEGTLTTKITGTGNTEFPTLYFNQPGIYEFKVTEADLPETEAYKGYYKDDTEYTVTVVVGNDYQIASVTDNKNQDLTATDAALAFDNEYSLTGTLTLEFVKEVENRAAKPSKGEFTFTVSMGGKVIGSAYATEEGGAITIDIPIDQDNIGTNTYYISENEGKDKTITYTDTVLSAEVTIEDMGDGTVKATEITYPDDNIFTNTYKASGSITMTGTKILKQGDKNVQIYDNEFDFLVTENGKHVATGTTEKDGKIVFDEIKYVAADIGEHTYTISEVAGKDVFVEYTDTTHTVVVSVTDAGSGKLSAAVTKVDGKTVADAEAAEAAILFTNTYTLEVPTGIRVEIIPYVLALALPVCFGAALLLRNRKRARARRR